MRFRSLRGPRVWPNRSATPRAERDPVAAKSGRVRSEVPPPGRAMSFPSGRRRSSPASAPRILEIRATRKGSKLVILRHGDREARLEDDVGAFVITFRSADAVVPMSALVDRDRRDAFTVRNLSHSVAGFFDARFTRA